MKPRKFTYTLAYTLDGQHYYIDGRSVTKKEFDREYTEWEFRKQLNRIERKLDKVLKGGK